MGGKEYLVKDSTSSLADRRVAMVAVAMDGGEQRTASQIGGAFEEAFEDVDCEGGIDEPDGDLAQSDGMVGSAVSMDVFEDGDDAEVVGEFLLEGVAKVLER